MTRKQEAADLEAYRVAKQKQFAERAEQQHPNTDVRRAAHATLIAGIRPATKPEKPKKQDTP